MNKSNLGRLITDIGAGIVYDPVPDSERVISIGADLALRGWHGVN